MKIGWSAHETLCDGKNTMKKAVAQRFHAPAQLFLIIAIVFFAAV